MQTAVLAEKSVAVAYGRHGFDAEALMAVVDDLDLSRYIGFAYGSGFEGQPQLLARLSEKLPLIGNSPDAVAAVKHPATFFAALKRLGIQHPDVRYSLPEPCPHDYLIKSGGGCGGTHIRSVRQLQPVLADTDYYQRKIDGQSISLLFLSNPHGVEVIGFNEQWLSPAAHAPYRYGGAVSNPVLAPGIREQLMHAAEMLAREFGLTGLNSIDAIAATANADAAATADSPVFVLEINPRLSATVDLYSAAATKLFELQVQACLKTYSQNLRGRRSHDQDPHNQNPYAQPQRNMQQPTRQHNAHAIVYAAAALELAAPVSWPDWVTDIPARHEKRLSIPAGEPVCTVLASAGSADAAKKLAQGRVETMQSLLQSLNGTAGVNGFRCTSAQGL